MSMFNSSLFDSIKNSLSKEPTSNRYENIMKLQAGNSYTVRLLPNIKDPGNTFFHYFSHAWESFNTGQFMSYLSPTTWGDKDPIAEMRARLYKHGTEEEKEKSKAVIRRENWLVNAYVISDPTKPENNGTVKIIRFGKQLHNIIMEAIQGEDADQFGPKIFDLSPNGCNLRIKVDTQSTYPTYVASKFLMPSEVSGLDPSEYDNIYNSCFQLDNILKKYTYEELENVLQEHYYCNVAPATVNHTQSVHTPQVSNTTTDDDDDDDGIPYKFDSNGKSVTSESSSSQSSEDSLSDDKIDELLKGLELN